MKSILFFLSFLFFTTGFSQEIGKETKEDSLNQQGLPYFKLREPAGYLLEKQEFTFTPELNRIYITRLQDEEEVDFGDLRRTTDDGLYIMTTTINDEVSFGRFDSIGNFRTLRYDKERDSIIEENYRIKRSDKHKQKP